MVPRDGQTVSKINTEIALSRTCSVCVLLSLQPSCHLSVQQILLSNQARVLKVRLVHLCVYLLHFRSVERYSVFLHYLTILTYSVWINFQVLLWSSFLEGDSSLSMSPFSLIIEKNNDFVASLFPFLSLTPNPLDIQAGITLTIIKDWCTHHNLRHISNSR